MREDIPEGWQDISRWQAERRGHRINSKNNICVPAGTPDIDFYRWMSGGKYPASLQDADVLFLSCSGGSRLSACHRLMSAIPSGCFLMLANGLKADLDAAQAAETHALALAATARDEANAKEWAFHNAVLGMRDQVIAQYGRDSNEAQAVGRKKESERKRPGRSSKKSPAS